MKKSEKELAEKFFEIYQDEECVYDEHLWALFEKMMKAVGYFLQENGSKKFSLAEFISISYNGKPVKGR